MIINLNKRLNVLDATSKLIKVEYNFDLIENRVFKYLSYLGREINLIKSIDFYYESNMLFVNKIDNKNLFLSADYMDSTFSQVKNDGDYLKVYSFDYFKKGRYRIEITFVNEKNYPLFEFLSNQFIIDLMYQSKKENYNTFEIINYAGKNLQLGYNNSYLTKDLYKVRFQGTNDNPLYITKFNNDMWSFKMKLDVLCVMQIIFNDALELPFENHIMNSNVEERELNNPGTDVYFLRSSDSTGLESITTNNYTLRTEKIFTGNTYKILILNKSADYPFICRNITLRLA